MIVSYLKYLFFFLLTILLGVQTTFAKTELVLPQSQVYFSIEQNQSFIPKAFGIEKEIQTNIGFLKEKIKFGKSTGPSTRINCNYSKEDVEYLANAGSDLLNASGKFIDDVLEADYLKYVTRKTNAGKTPRPRLEWKEVRDYWLFDSPLARGNAFNKKAVDGKWYPYNEVHLGNGKRVDSYKPPANGNPGEIISRKATDLGDIKLSTFESYLNEMVSKYSPGTAINSPKYSPALDGQTLQGQMFLEIPASNQSLSNIQDYINLASSKNITLRFKIE